MNIVATLNIGKAHITIGAHANEQTVGIEEGTLSRFTKFALSAQEAVDKHSDYKYSETNWMMFRL
tara:strand:+ start:791 stop:985 length:195 start_codon:yes stop_codon:yes gene_type:complete